MLDAASAGPPTPPRPPLDMEALFRHQVPPAMCEAIVRIFRDWYAAAPEMCRGLFARDQAHEASSRVRRAGIDTDVLRLSDFPGVRTDSLRSAGATYYVPIEVGDFTLIAARATNPNKMIPKAAYRLKIAIRAAQGELFGDDPVPEGARYYALILHGSTKGRTEPDFIRVRFPTSDHATFLDVSIDLKREYAHLFAAETAVQQTLGVEEIPDTTGDLRLRPQQGTGTLGTGAAGDSVRGGSSGGAANRGGSGDDDRRNGPPDCGAPNGGPPSGPPA